MIFSSGGPRVSIKHDLKNEGAISNKRVGVETKLRAHNEINGTIEIKELEVHDRAIIQFASILTKRLSHRIENERVSP